MGVGVAFGYGWIGALLIGSLLASHTLLGFSAATSVKRVAPIVTVTASFRTSPSS
jgi:hypothetical protein